MGTHPESLRHTQVSLSQWSVSPCASKFSRHVVPPRATLASTPALLAFLVGFFGSLVGGFAYCLILAFLQPNGLQVAVLRVLALSLTFGFFESWRVGRQRGPGALTGPALWTLGASLLVFWALGAAFSTEPSKWFRPDSPPHIRQVRLDPIA